MLNENRSLGTFRGHNTRTNSSSYVSINQLLSNTSYRVSVVGLSEETEGMPSEWISFKTNLTQGKFER